MSQVWKIWSPPWQTRHVTARTEVGLNAVIFAVSDQQPRVLTVDPEQLPEIPDALGPGIKGSGLAALPSGPFDPGEDRTLELALRNWVQRQTNTELGYVEQLYTFADQGRDPRERLGGPRVLSVAYLALIKEGTVDVAHSSWQDCYPFLPWEDWRAGRPDIIGKLAAALDRWVPGDDRGSGAQRRERVEICFGLGDAGWDGYRVLERYELLYEAGLVEEYWLDLDDTVPQGLVFGAPMAYDHRRILATGLGRLRGKLRYRPVVFELIERDFTLMGLQHVVEALSGLRLHKQNFRRLVERSGLVEGTGRQEPLTGGRPAELFRFRREVLRERRAPGVGALAGPRSD
jgi:hypothetical protein